MKEIDKRTPYQWCVNGNIRILSLDEKDELWYYTEEVEQGTFSGWLVNQRIKPNSTPRKTSPYLEYRMYGLVPYNISSIQGAIQYGHALQEYNNAMIDGIQNSTLSSDYVGFNKWRKEDKTFIILNGGTTNENIIDKWYGTLQKSRDILLENGVHFAQFKEPDLNNTLSAVVFLVDERVFNTELYPSYVDMPYPWVSKGRGYRPAPAETLKWENENNMNRAKWVDKIGGTKNDFLRTWLKNFRLAN